MRQNIYAAFAVELAEAAGDVIRPFFGNPSLTVDAKADTTPVTQADRDAESCIRERISRRFPDHGILGEEFGAERADAEFAWVIDPIDGTKSFITGCPLFGTLIALLHQGRPILGLIHQPILRQTCIGNGAVTTLNGRKVKVRPSVALPSATLLMTSFLSIRRHQDQVGFDRLSSNVALARTWGDCYGYLLVASGFADIMVDPIVNDWDKLALIPVIEGAGGVISDWQGGDPVTGTSIVAASRDLHPEVIGLLNGGLLPQVT